MAATNRNQQSLRPTMPFLASNEQFIPDAQSAPEACSHLRHCEAPARNGEKENVADKPGMLFVEDGGLARGQLDLSEPPSSPGSPDASPDPDGFTLSPQIQLPEQLGDSSAIQHIFKAELDETHLKSAWHEILKTIDAIHQLFILLVWLYNLELSNRLVVLVRSTDPCIIPAPVVIIFSYQYSFVHRPSWLLILLGNPKGCRRRRWIAACNIVWVDTTWRNFHNPIGHPLLRPLNTVRLRALITTPNLPRCSDDTPAAHWSEPLSLPIRTCGNGSNKRPTPISETADSANTNKKRRPGRGKNAGDDEESPERTGPGPSGKQAKGKETKLGGQNFACHFYKRWPIRHMVCLHHSQQAPRYVKTHLLRSHRQPIHCPTCYESFEARVTYNAHIIARGCDQNPGPCPFADAMSEDQERALGDLPVGDSIAKWYAMWDILFPGVPRPNSPFVNTDDIEGILLADVRDDRRSRFSQGIDRLLHSGTFDRQSVLRVFEETFSSTPPSSESPSNMTPGTNHLEPAQPMRPFNGHNVGGGGPQEAPRIRPRGPQAIAVPPPPSPPPPPPQQQQQQSVPPGMQAFLHHGPHQDASRRSPYPLSNITTARVPHPPGAASALDGHQQSAIGMHATAMPRRGHNGNAYPGSLGYFPNVNTNTLPNPYVPTAPAAQHPNSHHIYRQQQGYGIGSMIEIAERIPPGHPRNMFGPWAAQPPGHRIQPRPPATNNVHQHQRTRMVEPPMIPDGIANRMGPTPQYPQAAQSDTQSTQSASQDAGQRGSEFGNQDAASHDESADFADIDWTSFVHDNGEEDDESSYNGHG
ncbi:hypothetical protein EsH8_IV_001141 [Colletotrichum jinshuiense]